MRFQIEEVEGGFAPFARMAHGWRGLMIAGDKVVLVEKPLPVKTFQEAVLICEAFDDEGALKRHRALRVPIRSVMRNFDEGKV